MFSSFSNSFGFGRRRRRLTAQAISNIRDALSEAGQAAYDAAFSDEWFEVSAADYAAVVAGLDNAEKLGETDEEMAEPGASSWTTNQLTLNPVQADATVDSGEYIIGTIVGFATTGANTAEYRTGPEYQTAGQRMWPLNNTLAASGAGLKYFLRRTPQAQTATTYVGLRGITRTEQSSGAQAQIPYSTTFGNSWATTLARPMRFQSLVVDEARWTLPTSDDARVLHYDFSDANCYPGSGTTVSNLSKITLNGTLTNGAAYSADDGGVIAFDGVDDYINVPDNVRIQAPIGGKITVQIWANVSAYADNNGLFGKQFGASTYDGYSLALITDEGVRLQMNGNIVNGGYNSATGVWSLNTWHLFTAVIAFNGTAKAYVDTTEVVSVSNAELSLTATAALRIGQDIQDPGDRHPTMKVGAFYVYNRELSPAEIEAVRNATKSRYGL
jgi:hypothetical protein